MIVVIQCAARKQHDAGSLRTPDERHVLFVAKPDADDAESSGSQVYARPDDKSDWGESWRSVLQEYNANQDNNPFGLLQAWSLYKEKTYGLLLDHCGPDRLYILSAGWGLIRSDFLTPDYDITFSSHPKVAVYKRRRTHDVYYDFNMLPSDLAEPITFFGGKAYVSAFCNLTSNLKRPRYVWYNSKKKPAAPGCTLKRFHTTTRTNWHYECARAYVEGKLTFGSG